MISTTTLAMADGVRIVVPDSLNLITPYVFQEQLDWFEDEIKFVRCLLEPGDNVMDIGANYGAYALPMAKSVGPMGRVWAFEPASATAHLLAESLAANGFTQVILERSAVSSCSGTAQLSLNDNSELNALVSTPSASDACETVPVVTLDETINSYEIHRIDFLKIDAEGEEASILRGGDRFFSELSPLVQYEVKAGAVLHTELADSFELLGYSSYRLVPGLNVLVPLTKGSQPDSYLLNLFGCKSDRAQLLADRGLLVLADDRGTLSRTQEDRTWTQEDLNTSGYDWRHSIARQPYGIQLASLWVETVALGDSADVELALSLYALSRDVQRAPSDRFAALEASLGLLKPLCRRHPSYLRLASLARVAADYGERQLAVNALRQLAMDISLHQRADPSEPFLVPSAAFESISPGDGNIGNWIFSAVLEELERLESYSSFYSGTSSLQRLELIQKLGYGSAEMERRLQLVQRRFGLLDR
ncbi:FkbM family methyltransferase [Cyanobium sp. N.Huapi 1H5]|uniref:FkbM family methyltransferase n=1 Tax=Cyanobium sp. N.Huapi 1H5 TaxID=2823719 RepID=UPI0020CC67E6|nr:FkbM family methyltransferase [Cyanobium sp. N.Huapi 1H5]MCP9837860.1 FkbM family methyltransferase [Cyanobium sp. N.Huapi 1H5]